MVQRAVAGRTHLPNSARDPVVAAPYRSPSEGRHVRLKYVDSSVIGTGDHFARRRQITVIKTGKSGGYCVRRGGACRFLAVRHTASTLRAIKQPSPHHCQVTHQLSHDTITTQRYFHHCRHNTNTISITTTTTTTSTITHAPQDLLRLERECRTR
ncbi:hypothetical protein E2C01_033727 [Portunus trituberculatus]|uniref:Uncharacterized protein n=1 Tax=Portunus trituberculatus TaxID=210409 RepID=A0A5B7F0V8_PORTR|nr:hypothetical protein [Portunus trituberculatus]